MWLVVSKGRLTVVSKGRLLVFSGQQGQVPVVSGQ